jgi:Kef-type K+ transport system membrane component KefB
LGQPQVTGEMLAGIFLGPSMLGWLAPGLAGFYSPRKICLPERTRATRSHPVHVHRGTIGEPKASLRSRGQAAVLISHVSIAVPILLGTALAVRMYGLLSPPRVPFPLFAAFVGTAMSITAFPVLAIILDERGMLRSPAGTLATACAAVDDVTGWSL